MWILLLRTVVMIAPCCIMTLFLFHDQLKCPGWIVNSLCILLTAISIILGYFIISPLNPVIKWQFLYTLGFILVLVLSFASCIDYTLSQVLFILFIFANYADIVDMCAAVIFYLKAGYLPQFSTSIPALVLQFIITLILAPLLWAFMRYFLKPTLDCTRHLPFWHFLWGIPFCFFLIFRTNIFPDYGRSATFISSFFPLVPCLWMFATFFSYFFILYSLRQTAETISLEEKLHISEVHLASQEKQLDGLQQKIEDVRRSKHDLRHFLLSLRGHASNHDYNSIINMIDEHLSSLHSTETLLLCENAALNAIICYYKNLAEEHEIAFTLTSDLPTTFPYPEADLCIILGNLVENAVEACMRQKHYPRFVDIRLTMISNRILTFIVKNSYEGTIRHRHNDFSSSKRKGIGIGIASIRSIVQKYYGTTKFEYHDGVFKASVLFNYPKDN